jgi:hypothetical protein
MLRWILFVVFVALVEIYAFQAVKTLTKIRWVHYAYLLTSLIIIIYIIYSFTQFDRSVGQNKHTLFTMGLLLITYLPKLIFVIVLFSEDIVRVLTGMVSAFTGTAQVCKPGCLRHCRYTVFIAALWYD